MENGSGHDHQQMDMRRGDPILGENTIWWALAGLLIGGAAGWLIGIAFGYGRFNIAGLAPLATGGAGVAGLIFASFFSSLLGLAGALLGTSSEARKAHKDHSEANHQATKHGKTTLIERLPIYGSIALVLFMAFTLYVIASRAIGSGEPSDQSNRVTWNQKNVSRVGGATDTETAIYVLQTAYPATRAENRPGTIVTVADDWCMALAATRLIAKPTNAALIFSRRFRGEAFIYLFGDPSIIPDSVQRELAAYGHVQRLPGRDAYEISVNLAGFRDAGLNQGYWIDWFSRDFGWGIAEAGHNFTFANPDDWQQAVTGSLLSHMGKHGPMILVRRSGPDEKTMRYLEMVKPSEGAPSDQLNNHGWILGGTDRVSWMAQADIDMLLEPKGEH